MLDTIKHYKNSPKQTCIAYLLLLSFIMISMRSQGQIAQAGYPMLGEVVPPFKLTEVKYYNKAELSSDDLKGKYVILDLWTKSCASCIQAFPHLDTLQKKFKDKLLIILVGLDWGDVRKEYELYRNAFDLQLVSAYDSVLHQPPFNPLTTLSSYWIDPEGVVKAISSHVDITEQNIRSFMAGKNFSHEDNSVETLTAEKSAYDEKRPLGLNGNGGGSDEDFLYRSLLSEWKPGMGTYYSPPKVDAIFKYQGVPKFEAMRIPAYMLFNYAYFGEGSLPHDYYRHPYMEDGNSQFYKDTISYNYSLIVPKSTASREKLMEVMQADLKNYFGYTASIESREVPVYVVKKISSRADALKTHGADTREISRREKKFKNITVTSVINGLMWNGLAEERPVIDETGLGKIDFDFTGVEVIRWEKVNELLSNYGLKVINGKRKVKTLVYHKAST